ncbi:MAG: hypothetical protein KAS73_02785, partial [Candidatus Sabulitectum sp.]|nr:hypothetical protein [Candidatus Sabulitectum sp.]
LKSTRVSLSVAFASSAIVFPGINLIVVSFRFSKFLTTYQYGSILNAYSISNTEKKIGDVSLLCASNTPVFQVIANTSATVYYVVFAEAWGF